MIDKPDLVYAECSGAMEARIPGEYAEILLVHANDTSPNLEEIEKDVSRTFPGNVFFGEHFHQLRAICLHTH